MLTVVLSLALSLAVAALAALVLLARRAAREEGSSPAFLDPEGERRRLLTARADAEAARADSPEEAIAAIRAALETLTGARVVFLRGPRCPGAESAGPA